jgi:hypothetical protein
MPDTSREVPGEILKTGPLEAVNECEFLHVEPQQDGGYIFVCHCGLENGYDRTTHARVRF